jgi:hypothetical protein
VISAWCPESRISGTEWPSKTGGRVYCGYSSKCSENDSWTGESSAPSTPGTSRATVGRVVRQIVQSEAHSTEPGDGIDHHQGGELAAGQHVVTDGELPVGQVLGDSLVDTLVAATDQEGISGSG